MREFLFDSCSSESKNLNGSSDDLCTMMVQYGVLDILFVAWLELEVVCDVEFYLEICFIFILPSSVRDRIACHSRSGTSYTSFEVTHRKGTTGDVLLVILMTPAEGQFLRRTSFLREEPLNSSSSERHALRGPSTMQHCREQAPHTVE